MEFFGTIIELFKTFNWHTPSWDLFILLFWLVASVIYAFSAGSGRILTILVSTYMAQLLVIEMPFLTEAVSQRVEITTGTLQQLVAFAVLFIILFIFLSKYAFRTSIDGRKFSSIGFGLIFSILQIGLLINIVIGYLPLEVINDFSPLIMLMFAHQNSNFIWLILPILFLIILGRFISDNSDL
ncbi:MAG TPA: hypothetical protein PKD79_03590 [Candidatus Doudnabacteria bacterium]|nr:hypothetical protein [Candidatus Doudnabacteria bacterium]